MLHRICINSKTRSEISVILAQPTEVGHATRTIEVSIPSLPWQDTGSHTGLVIPLRSPFCRPSPIKPTPGCLEADHLRLRIHHQPLLVIVRIATRIGVGVTTRACTRFRRAVGRSHGYRPVAALQCALPPCAGTDVVEVGRAVCVCLRPLAAQCGAEPGHVCQ